MQRGSSGLIALVLPLCFLTSVLTDSPAMALDLGEWVPGLKLSPFLSERVEYNSNVFQTPNHAQDDVIFKTIPGFVVDYTFGKHSVSAGYRAEILNYVSLTDQDTVHHIMAFQLRLDFPRWLLTLNDEFTRTSDPPNSELTGPILSTTNVLTPAAEFRVTPRFSTGVSYSWTHVRFDDPSIGDLIDRDEHAVAGSVYWKFVPKGDIGLTYRYDQTNFTEATDRDYHSHEGRLGLRGDLTAKLSSTLYVGYLWRIAEHSDQVGWNGATFGGDLTYRPTERTTITLSADRRPQESTFLTDPFYVTTNATLLAQHQLLPKLSIGGRIGGGVNDYATKQTVGSVTDWRRDSFLSVGAQAEYTIQPWLRVGLEYLFTRRDSNFNTFDFFEHLVTGRVTLQF
jgi:putative beta-barrel porin BBP2